MVEEDKVALKRLGINCTNNDNQRIFHGLCNEFLQAIEENNVQHVETLLKTNPSFPSLIHVTNKFGYEPIHIAAKKGHIDMVRLLANYSIDINKLAPDGKDPLDLAIESNNINLIQMLLEMVKSNNQPDQKFAQLKKYFIINVLYKYIPSSPMRNKSLEDIKTLFGILENRNEIKNKIEILLGVLIVECEKIKEHYNKKRFNLNNKPSTLVTLLEDFKNTFLASLSKTGVNMTPFSDEKLKEAYIKFQETPIEENTFFSIENDTVVQIEGDPDPFVLM